MQQDNLFLVCLIGYQCLELFPSDQEPHRTVLKVDRYGPKEIFQSSILCHPDDMDRNKVCMEPEIPS